MSNYKSYYLKSLGLREDQLPGGKGDEATPSQFDPQQLEMGIKVEMEHTQDPNLAREIAMDHLSEDPEYYTHLKNAGMADELPNGQQPQQGPMMMNKLMSPSKIISPQVIAVAVRGTYSGGLPAGGQVEDPEKARFGGWEKMKVLPQGGVVGDPEKARLGGLERVKNLKPNSQGAISDTPASDQIKAPGGHFTPDNGEITRGEAPKTNREGSDAIHPMQFQQLGNPPIEDDGTTHDGKHTPAAAEAGIEGGKAPESKAEEHPLSKFVAGDGGEEDLSKGEEPEGINRAEETKEPEEKEEKEKGPWGLEMDREEEKTEEKPEEDDEEKKKGEDVAIDIKECETCGCGDPHDDHGMVNRFQKLANIRKEGWAQGEYTPQQQAALDILMKKGFREVGSFPGEPDADGGNMGNTVTVVLQKKQGPMRLSCEVDPDGSCNGLPVDKFLATQVREAGELSETGTCPRCGLMQTACKCNIAPQISSAKKGRLKELVDQLKKSGKNGPALQKAEAFMGKPDFAMDNAAEIRMGAADVQSGRVDALIQMINKHRDLGDSPEDVADAIVAKAQDNGIKGIERQYEKILAQVKRNWK